MVPRPDVSKATGSPDVCLGCHSDKKRTWSINTVAGWFPDLYQSTTWYQVQHQRLSKVVDYLNDRDKPALRRATLLEQQGEVLVRRRFSLVRRLLDSDSVVIRESAFRVLRHGSLETVQTLAETGLDDPALTVRIAAFETLAWLGGELGSDAGRRVRQEYRHYLDMQSDLPSGRVLKAKYLQTQGKIDEAEEQLGIALEKDRGYDPAVILLTDILRASGRNREAIQVIDKALSYSPGTAQLVHLRGLVNLKLRDYPAALTDLEQAAKLEPERWLFGYRYAVALYQLDQQEKARKVARTLLALFPENPKIQALVRRF